MATGVELYESVYLITGRHPILVIYFKYRVKRWMTMTSTLNHRFRMLGKKMVLWIEAHQAPVSMVFCKQEY